MAATVRTVISPGRYVQGKGAIAQLGEYLKQIGSTPLIVADDLVWGFVGHDVEASLTRAGLPVRREKFNGIPSAKEVDRLVEVIKATGSDVALAVGGGSTIDAVKAAGFLAGIRWANSPTVASTDAPCSALSVIYTETGEFSEYRFFPRNPDLVLVDSQIVANAPVQLLIAGVGDALATWLEARATARVELQDHGRRAAHADRHRAGRAQLGGAVGERTSGDRRGARPPGDARCGEGHRGEHAALGSWLRVRRFGCGTRHPQRADRRAADPRIGARAEGEHRIGDATDHGRRARPPRSATSSSSPPGSGCRPRSPRSACRRTTSSR